MKTQHYMILLFISTFLFIACDKDLGLNNKYDNSNSSILPNPEDNLNPDNTVEFDDFFMTEPIVINQAGADMQGFWPDGKLSVVQDQGNGDFALYWAEKYSIRTEGSTPFPENHIGQVRPENRVFGIGFNEMEGFTDGGSWFIGVHRLTGNRLAGFFHAESHWEDATAYKSVGIAYSEDNGRTWTEGEKILNVDHPKPLEPRWSGLGDGCVIYHDERQQYICYYSAYIPNEDFKISMAVSDDPAGAPGTWRKWDGAEFTIEGYDSETGLGGADHKIAGLDSRSGANPSVMWNTHIQKWIMVYAGWDNVIYMSTSADGIEWSVPFGITDLDQETATYPNLIGEDGDLEGAKVVKLYYGRNQQTNGVRQLAYRILTFK